MNDLRALDYALLAKEMERLRKENETLKAHIKITISKEKTGIMLYGFRGGRGCFMNWAELNYICENIEEFKKRRR